MFILDICRCFANHVNHSNVCFIEQPGVFGDGTMEYTNLGRTSVQVSKLCLECMNFGWKTDEDREKIDEVVPPGSVVTPYYEADFGPAKYRW